MVKRLLLWVAPLKQNRLLQQLSQRSGFVREIWDEFVVVVDESNKLLQGLDITWGIPVPHSSHLVCVYTQFATTNHMAKVLHGGLAKRTFLQFRKQFVLGQLCKDPTQVSIMVLFICTINQNVI